MFPAGVRLRVLASTPERLLWAIWVRWLVIGGFLGLAVAGHAAGLFVSIGPCIQVALAGGALNALNQWCVRHRRHVLAVTVIAIPVDHVFITYLVVKTGGVQSPFVMLYVVEVLATAMLVDTVVAAGSAVLAILLWIAALSGQAAGYVSVPPLFRAGTVPSTIVYQGTWAAFLCYCLALLVYLGGYISERLRNSEHDLEEKNRRLQDALSSVRAAHEALQVAYARLQQTEAHLVQSEKMRSLGELVAGVAHELNNPISFISGNVEHLRDYVTRLREALDAYAGTAVPAAERARLDGVCQDLRIDEVLADLPGLLDDCEEGARRTAHIVSELRAFSRSDEHEAWQVADLHRGIESTLGLLAHRFKGHIAVHREFGALPEVECVPGSLNQVFMNLLANAADAIGAPTGNVWITTGRLDAPDCEPRVSVAIRDDGPGMSAETCAKVFDPFFTTKPAGQGIGLGLSVSYGIVQRHRGTLTVESRPGAGSTFTITIPVRQTA